MPTDNERRARSIADSLLLDGATLATAVELIREGLDEAEARGAAKWRPVSERPERGRYLVALRGMQNPQIAYTSGCGDWSKANVTHWQELPPTPSEEKR